VRGSKIMYYKRIVKRIILPVFFLISGLFLSIASVAAETIIIKIDEKLQKVALDETDKKNYVGSTEETKEEKGPGSSKNIYRVLLTYQWPTCIMFAQTMSPDDRKELFAPRENAEIDFIKKKVKEISPNYDAIFVPTTIIELFVISYYLKNPTSDIFTNFSKSVYTFFDNFCGAKTAAKQKNSLGQRFDAEEFYNNIRTTPSFLEECKSLYTDLITGPAIAQAYFLIHCQLGAYYLEKRKAGFDDKAIAADLISQLVTAYEENGSKIPGQAKKDKPLDFSILKKELDEKTVKPNGIMSNAINAHILAHKTNKATLWRGMRTFRQVLSGLSASEYKTQNKEEGVQELYERGLRGSGSLRTLEDLAKNAREGTLLPRTLSYGTTLLDGCFYASYSCAYEYFTDKNNYGYALLIDKSAYIKNNCNDLFIIPPFDTLTQQFAHFGVFHSFSKAAMTKVPDELIKIDGYAWPVRDTSGTFLITRDPLKHAQLLANYISKNALLIKVPSHKVITGEAEEASINRENTQLQANLKQAATFYKSFQATQKAVLMLESAYLKKPGLKRAIKTNTDLSAILANPDDRINNLKRIIRQLLGPDKKHALHELEKYEQLYLDLKKQADSCYSSSIYDHFQSQIKEAIDSKKIDQKQQDELLAIARSKLGNFDDWSKNINDLNATDFLSSLKIASPTEKELKQYASQALPGFLALIHKPITFTHDVMPSVLLEKLDSYIETAGRLATIVDEKSEKIEEKKDIQDLCERTKTQALQQYFISLQIADKEATEAINADINAIKLKYLTEEEVKKTQEFIEQHDKDRTQKPLFFELLSDLKNYKTPQSYTDAGDVLEHALWAEQIVAEWFNKKKFWCYGLNDRDKYILAVAALLLPIGQAGDGKFIFDNDYDEVEKPNYVDDGAAYILGKKDYILKNNKLFNFSEMFKELGISPDEQKLIAILIGMQHKFGIVGDDLADLHNIMGLPTSEQVNEVYKTYLSTLQSRSAKTGYEGTVDEKMLRMALFIDVCNDRSSQPATGKVSVLFERPFKINPIRHNLDPIYGAGYEKDAKINFDDLITFFRKNPMPSTAATSKSEEKEEKEIKSSEVAKV